MDDQCNEALQGRNTIYFHRCPNRAKADAVDAYGRPLRVCGVHARQKQQHIKFAKEA